MDMLGYWTLVWYGMGTLCMGTWYHHLTLFPR
jgi:hypothetical protein